MFEKIIVTPFFLSRHRAAPPAGERELLFPDAEPAQILRRGVLDCEPEVSVCVFVLIPPNSLRSLE